jgi:hypothetical protein
MARAQGARAQMALAFETTYGTPPASGFIKMPFARTTLGAEQPLQAFCNRAFVVKRNFQREANGQTGRLASMVCVVGD